MTKFVALYMAPAPVIAEMMQATPEQMKTGMADWMKWGDAHKTDIVEMGAPLGKTMKVTAEGSSEMKNGVTGYSVVEADSHADAAKIFAGNPHLQMQGTWIEIIECVQIPGM